MKKISVTHNITISRTVILEVPDDFDKRKIKEAVSEDGDFQDEMDAPVLMDYEMIEGEWCVEDRPATASPEKPHKHEKFLAALESDLDHLANGPQPQHYAYITINVADGHCEFTHRLNSLGFEGGGQVDENVADWTDEEIVDCVKDLLAVEKDDPVEPVVNR